MNPAFRLTVPHIVLIAAAVGVGLGGGATSWLQREQSLSVIGRTTTTNSPRTLEHWDKNGTNYRSVTHDIIEHCDIGYRHFGHRRKLFESEYKSGEVIVTNAWVAPKYTIPINATNLVWTVGTSLTNARASYYMLSAADPDELKKLKERLAKLEERSRADSREE